MSQENGNATFLTPFSSDVDIQDPNRTSRISYTREFLLSLAKAGTRSTVKLPWDVQLSISCLFQDSTGLLSLPFCVPDSRFQNIENSMPQKISLKVPLPDDINLLHRSNEPYRPPCRHKALPPSTIDSNDWLNGDTFGSSECTNQEKAELEGCGKGISGSMKESTYIPDVKIQQEMELNSSNIMLHDSSNFSSELCLPDEDSLITFDEPFLMPEVENSAVIDRCISSPESNLIEADLCSPSSPCFDWIEKLVESILNDDSSPDPYPDDPMMHHGAGLDDICLSMYEHQSYAQVCSNQLNLGRDQQDHTSFQKNSIDPAIYSLFSHSYPSNKNQFLPLSHHDELIRRFGHEVGQPMFQQTINPGKLNLCSSQLLELPMAFCTQKLNPKQNSLGQEPSYESFYEAKSRFSW